MIRITWAAQDQIDDLLRYFLDKKRRPEAARRLLADLATACDLIEAEPQHGARYPRPDRDQQLERFGFKWRLVRVYWVSWAVLESGPVITNVLHQSADIVGRASPTTDDVEQW